VTIFRGGQVVELGVQLGVEDGLGTGRLVHWCGAQLQAPHRAVRELGFLPGVCVGGGDGTWQGGDDPCGCFTCPSALHSWLAQPVLCTNHVGTVPQPEAELWQWFCISLLGIDGAWLPAERAGVYISRWHHGSPAHRYGLYALHWISDVNSRPTPDLDTFLEVGGGGGDAASALLHLLCSHVKAACRGRLGRLNITALLTAATGQHSCAS
jgi:hypothetical protein